MSETNLPGILKNLSEIFNSDDVIHNFMTDNENLSFDITRNKKSDKIEIRMVFKCDKSHFMEDFDKAVENFKRFVDGVDMQEYGTVDIHFITE